MVRTSCLPIATQGLRCTLRPPQDPAARCYDPTRQTRTSRRYLCAMRSFALAIPVLLSLALSAQPMDSIHVYKRVPMGTYSSARANALAWQLHQQEATHRTLKGSELEVVREAMAEYRPQRHTYGALPGLSHVAMAFSGGRPVAFGVTDDLGRVINFTARTEYRISTWAEHLAVRALLSQLLVE